MWGSVHGMDIPHFVYPFIIWWPFGSLPLFDYDESRTFLYKVLVDICFQFWWYIPSCRIAGSKGNMTLLFEALPNWFPKWLYHFTSLLEARENSSFSTPWSHLVLSICLIVTFLVGIKCACIHQCLGVVWICISLKTADVEYLVYFLIICLFSLEKEQCQSFAHFWTGLLVF